MVKEIISHGLWSVTVDTTVKEYDHFAEEKEYFTVLYPLMALGVNIRVDWDSFTAANRQAEVLSHFEVTIFSKPKNLYRLGEYDKFSGIVKYGHLTSSEFGTVFDILGLADNPQKCDLCLYSLLIDPQHQELVGYYAPTVGGIPLRSYVEEGSHYLRGAIDNRLKYIDRSEAQLLDKLAELRDEKDRLYRTLSNLNND